MKERGIDFQIRDDIIRVYDKLFAHGNNSVRDILSPHKMGAEICEKKIINSFCLCLFSYNSTITKQETVPGHSETTVLAGEGTFEIQDGGDKGDVFCSGMWSRDNVWSNNTDFPQDTNVWKPLCKATDAVKKISQSHIQPFQFWTMKTEYQKTPIKILWSSGTKVTGTKVTGSKVTGTKVICNPGCKNLRGERPLRKPKWKHLTDLHHPGWVPPLRMETQGSFFWSLNS